MWLYQTASYPLLLLLLLLHSIHYLTVLGHGDIYTSMSRVVRMVRSEKRLLRDLRDSLPNSIRDKKDFSRFYQDRIAELEERNISSEVANLHHPNSVYLILQEFARKYHTLRNLPALTKLQSTHLNKLLQSVADNSDVTGALLALLKLQEVYKLNSRDMMEGYYFNMSGPKLSYMDAFSLGNVAFFNGQHGKSVEWLKLAVCGKFVSDPDKMELGDEGIVNMTGMVALLASALIKTGEWKRVTELYKTLKSQDERESKIILLLMEMMMKPPAQDDDDDNSRKENVYKNHFPLCASTNRGVLLKEDRDPRLVCRYRGRVPYFRYKEELLSVVPYLSIFYSVITDREGRQVKKLSLNEMARGGVGVKGGFVASYRRTSQTAFLADKMSKTLTRLSRRISYMTGLNTSASTSGFLSPTQSAAEPLQVANYGLGGHFSLHKDPLEFFNEMTQNMLTYSGNRLATFLIYLTDVQVGGQTTFPKIPQIVTPMKNSAIFWYNYNPAGDMEEATYHAGCPVVVGDKWIANKWILSHANTFIRRCGLHRNSSQLDIEDDMIPSSYRS